MQKFTVLLLLIISFSAFASDFEEENFYVSISHISTTHAQGYHIAKYAIKNMPGGKDIDYIDIKFKYIGENNETEYEGKLSIGELLANRYNNYAEKLVEAKNTFPEKMVITSVIAKVGKKKRNLLKEGKFGVEEFKPLTIEIKK